MFGLTGGELFVVVFILFAVVSASWWPRLGEAIAVRLTGASGEDEADTEPEAADTEEDDPELD